MWGFIFAESCTDPPRVLPNTSVLEFQFFLPPGLPPSFTSPLGNKGHVEYRLELNKSMGTSEKTLYKCVILVAPFLSLAGNVAATVSTQIYKFIRTFIN